MKARTARTRTARSRTAAALVGGLVVLATALVPWAAASAADSSGQGDAPEGKALETLSTCVADGGRLLVVLLVDESGSLQQTDPDDVRVSAAKTALTGLSDLATSTTNAPEVDVLVSAFSYDFQRVGEWTPLDVETLPELTDSVGTLAARDNGMDTDITHALDGAREALSERAVEVTGGQNGTGGNDKVCKAILLFTDGRYDIGYRGTPELVDQFGDSKDYAPGIVLDSRASAAKARAAGVKELCRPGGVADQVRADGISLLTVPLTAQLRLRDEAFLSAVTTGKGLRATCGERDGTDTGVYVPAGDVVALVRAFDSVATQIAGGTPTGGPTTLTVCQGDPCEQGTIEVAVDESLRAVHLFASLPDGKVALSLDAPSGGDPLEVPAGKGTTTTYGGATVVVRRPDAKALTIDITPKAGGDATGTWKATFVTPEGGKGGKAIVQAFGFTDLEAVLTDTPPVRAGQPVPLRAKIVRAQGSDASSIIDSATVTATVTDPVSGRRVEVPLRPDGKEYVGTYAAPASLTSSLVEVVLRLRATTTDGVALTSTSPAESLATRRPPGYPQIGPARLALTAVTGEGEATADLVAIAGDGPAGGCVWVGPADVRAAPADAAPVVVGVIGTGRTKAACVRPAKGTPLTVEVTMTPADRASGTVSGTLRVWSASAAGAPVATDVPFEFEMTRGVDTAKQITLAVGLLVAGIALPMLLLLAMNAVSIRFQAVDKVRGAVVPVVVRRNGEVVRVGEDGRRDQLSLFGSDFESLSGAGHRRRFTWAGLVFSVRTSLNPFAAGYAVATPEGGAADVAKEGRRVELDLGLAGSWVFLYDQDQTNAASMRILGEVPAHDPPPEIHGRLVAFVAEGPVAPQTARMIDDVATRLPSTANRLDGLARDARRG